MKKWTFALVAILLTLTGCTVSTGPDEVAAQYNDGMFSSKTWDTCVETSDREWYGPSDYSHTYYASQRNLAFPDKDDGTDAITFVTADGIEMSVAGLLNFRLNTSCEPIEVDGKKYPGGVLQYFDQLLGGRYEAYTEAGEDDEVPEGWLKLIRNYVFKPLDTAVDRAGQQFTYLELYGNAAKKAAWEQAVLDLLPDLVDRQTDGEDVSFFTDYALTLQKPDPPGKIKDALLAKQEAIAKAEAAEAQSDAEEQAALAEVKVAKAQAEKRREAIAGFGSVEAYLNYIALTEGLNPFQPTIVYGPVPVPKPKE